MDIPLTEVAAIFLVIQISHPNHTGTLTPGIQIINHQLSGGTVHHIDGTTTIIDQNFAIRASRHNPSTQGDKAVAAGIDIIKGYTTRANFIRDADTRITAIDQTDLGINRVRDITISIENAIIIGV